MSVVTTADVKESTTASTKLQFRRRPQTSNNTIVATENGSTKYRRNFNGKPGFSTKQRCHSPKIWLVVTDI